MRIKKISQPLKVESSVIDSLESNSTTNAPSIHAVNEALKEVYSTEEIVIGKWLGKPLYRKVFTGNWGTIVDGTDTVIQEDISTLNLEQCIRMEGMSSTGVGFQTFLMISSLGYRANAYILGNNTILNIRANTSTYSNQSYVLILEYTKTTD